jgi:DNA polymerase-2
MTGYPTTTFDGWLLDIYADAQDGAVLWLIEQGAGPDAPRRRLRQAFPVTFYAAGQATRLRQLWRWLRRLPGAHQLSREERRDLSQPGLLPVMAIQVSNPLEQERLFKQASQVFPDLTYYDADISLPLRHAARYGTFPLARLQVTLDSQDRLQDLQVLDSPWDQDPEPPPLRILQILPDCDPRRQEPGALRIVLTDLLSVARRSYRLSLEPARPLLVNLAAILRQCDPDLIQSAWGDTWLLPYLLEISDKWGLPLPLNRDPQRAVLRKREHSFFSYGQVIHRGQQVHLFGRWHVDIYNAMMFHDYGLDGILESARVTGNPLQTAARLSPGSGISAMQVVTALRSQVLVPWHKQQAEHAQSSLDLLRADQGGLVYQPLAGLHHNVAEIDFISMYPGIMVHFNISPETVAGLPADDHAQLTSARVPMLNLWVDQPAGSGLEEKGLIPRTLAPLLDKRIALKHRLAELPNWDPRRKQYKARAAAHKWLLVTCFGYLGYKNARFGRVEAHQAVTAYSREALLRAKEAAEDLGFEVLHMYVDGLWVKKPGCASPPDIQPLLDEIAARTRLPIALEGIYRWVAFLPSRVNPKVPVANRYFGVFQNGEIKVRGIDARRQDTPAWIGAAQMQVVELLGQAQDSAQLAGLLAQALAFLRRQLKLLRAGQAPLKELVVTQKLSRDLDLYRTPSPAARAAAQLAAHGKHLRPGQAVRFVYTRGEPGVYAWDLGGRSSQGRGLNPSAVDTGRYCELLLRAASTVLQPFGLSESILHDRLVAGAQPQELFNLQSVRKLPAQRRVLS